MKVHKIARCVVKVCSGLVGFFVLHISAQCPPFPVLDAVYLVSLTSSKCITMQIDEKLSSHILH